MCINHTALAREPVRFARKPVRSECRVSTAGVVLVLLIVSCAGTPEMTLDFIDGGFDPSVLALRFAPRLYLHEKEPYGLVAIVPVLHPAKPIFAYHIFFESEGLLVIGDKLDHEIVWVEFDPVTLKVMDVATYWHRTVLRTKDCVLDARRAGQRPRVDVQWGQHGMLPFGWRSLRTARPRAELVIYYGIMHNRNRKNRNGRELHKISFSGSYEEYCRFDVYTDTAPYIEGEGVIVTDDPDEALQSRLKGIFAEKKEWPDW